MKIPSLTVFVRWRGWLVDRLLRRMIRIVLDEVVVGDGREALGAYEIRLPDLWRGFAPIVALKLFRPLGNEVVPGPGSHPILGSLLQWPSDLAVPGESQAGYILAGITPGQGLGGVVDLGEGGWGWAQSSPKLLTQCFVVESAAEGGETLEVGRRRRAAVRGEVRSPQTQTWCRLWYRAVAVAIYYYVICWLGILSNK